MLFAQNRVMRKTSAGFSLVEVLIVVMIIMIMGAVSLPAIARYIHNYQIRSGTQQVASTLSTARLKAISTNTQVGISFAVTGQNTYQYVIEDSIAKPPAWWTPTGENFANMVGINGYTTGQAGPPMTLPANLRFAAPTVCGGLAATDYGFRFTNLGGACQFGTGSCGVAPSGAPAYTNYLSFNGGSVTVCLLDPTTNLNRWVTVTPGGRVMVQQ